MDIYAPDMHQPARVEYWDDEIDSLASFDLLTQRRDGALEKIYLSPAREVLFGSTADTADALRAAQKKARGKRRTALEKAMEADLAQLDSGCLLYTSEQLSCDAISIPEWKLELMAKKIFEKVWGNQNKAILRACKMIESCQNGKAATRMSAAPIQSKIKKSKRAS